MAEEKREELQGTIDNNINIIMQNENLFNADSINDLYSALITKTMIEK